MRITLYLHTRNSTQVTEDEQKCLFKVLTLYILMKHLYCKRNLVTNFGTYFLFISSFTSVHIFYIRNTLSYLQIVLLFSRWKSYSCFGNVPFPLMFTPRYANHCLWMLLFLRYNKYNLPLRDKYFLFKIISS